MGSGNSEIPCARMHTATLSTSTSACSENAGPAPLWGRSFWHFACAALNAGAEGLIPAVEKIVPPPGCGSEKLGTPLARMHLANASGDGVVEPEPVAPALVTVLDPVAGACPALVAVDAGVLAPPAVATGLGELPPQPASSTPVRSVATANMHARGERVSRFG